MGRECWCRRSVGAAVPAAGLTASDVGNQHFARHHDAVQACARRFPLTRFPPRRTLVASPTHGGYDMRNIRIDGQRLWDSIMEMAKIGATAKGGSNRQTLTDEDKTGRDLFVQIGSASCRERVCTYVESAVVAGAFKTKTND